MLLVRKEVHHQPILKLPLGSVGGRLRVRQSVNRQRWRWVGAIQLLVQLVRWVGRLVACSLVMVTCSTILGVPPRHAAIITNAPVHQEPLLIVSVQIVIADSTKLPIRLKEPPVQSVRLENTKMELVKPFVKFAPYIPIKIWQASPIVKHVWQENLWTLFQVAQSKKVIANLV